MRHRDPTRRRAGGPILPHKPGNWQTADGQVHFPSGVSGLRYGRATPFRDGSGWDVDCLPELGGCRRVVEGASTWRPEAFPSPSPLRFKCCAISPLLVRLGLIVRGAATARGLPHPGTARGEVGWKEWGRARAE